MTGDKVEIPSLIMDRADPATFEGFIRPKTSGFDKPATLFGGDFHGVFIETNHRWNFGWTTDHFRVVGARECKEGERVHVAGVRSGNQIALYVDGKLTGSESVEPCSRFSFVVRLGGDAFIGRMDEIRISNAARYDKNFSAPERFDPDVTTLALYHCDEGQGEVLTDSSGNKHHGKIIGAKWVHADGRPIDLKSQISDSRSSATAADANTASLTTVPRTGEPQTVNLLPLIDPARDAVPSGQWEQKAGELIGKGGVVEAPYLPPKEYDVVAEFTRMEGETGPELMLSLSGQPFRWLTGASKDQWYGPIWVDNAFQRIKGPVLNLGQRYQVRIAVRENGFGGFVDGKRVDWFKYSGEKLRNPAARTKGLGLRVPDSTIVFHRFEVIEVTGRGEVSRAAPTEKTPPTVFTNALGMQFALVPKGTARLGGGDGAAGSKEVEFPEDFYLGVYAVTQEEWVKMMGSNPSRFSRQGAGKDAVKDISDAELKRFPVETISWDEAQSFVKLLNEHDKQAGWKYRLPTEAEWEYACRGGPMSDPADGSFDYYFENPTNELLPAQANFGKGEAGRTCPVGSYDPNQLGLHDMHGNVHVWCDDEVAHPNDPSGATHRVLRGGSYWSPLEFCRAANRFVHLPSYRYSNIGLRVARVPVAAGASTDRD